MTETTILALYGLLVLLTLVLQATGALTQVGIGYLLSSRDDPKSVSGIAARLDRALGNSITAMALFAPAVLLLIATDQTDSRSLLAATVFLIARALYLPSYAMNLIGVRTLAWAAGFVSTVALYLLAF